MLAIMADRIRIIIDTSEENRLAVRLAAVKSGKSPSQILNELIERHLADELADAKRYVPKPKRTK